ncbi:MAG: hypothetical protein IJW71_03585 [Clostridia bacterium]|nr:hypothetical protein [Clostridia bacterium]
MKKLTRILLVSVLLALVLLTVFGCSKKCKHTETETVGAKTATCAAEGYTGDTVCKSCKATVTKGKAIAKTEHTLDAGIVTKNPSCIETGVKTFTCSTCKGTTTEAIAVVPHSDLYHDALDGTHTHTCAHCTISENAKHTPTDAGIAMPASCLEPAYTQYVCADCAGVYKVYVDGSEANGHDWNDFVTSAKADCTHTGEMSHSCKNCPAVETIEIPVNPNVHVYSEFVVTEYSTCQTHGEKTQFCLWCAKPNTVELPLAAHAFVDAGNDSGDGWIHQSCSTDHCGATRSYFDASAKVDAEMSAASIPDDQNLSLNMKEASIDLPADLVAALKESGTESISVKADIADKSQINTDGLSEEEKARLESVDVYEFGITTDAGYVSGNFAADVTVTLSYTLKEGEDAEGIVIWFVNEQTGKVEQIDATYDETTETVSFTVSHFSKYAVAYTETQEMKCRRGVHNHVPTGESVPASCRQYGYTVYECSACHAVEYGNFVQKLDHAYGEVQQPTVTCEEGGYTYRVCGTCNDVQELNYVRAKGHTVTAAPTCTEGASCSTCHTVVKPALGHKYTEWTVVIEPSAVSSGLKRRSCLNCGELENVELAPEGTVEALDFKSYEEYLTYMVDTIGLCGGTLKLEIALPIAMFFEDANPDDVYPFDFEVVFAKDANGRLSFTANGTAAAVTGGGEEMLPVEVSALLSAGELYIYYAVEGMESGMQVTNLEMASGGLPYDIIGGVYEQIFDELNVVVEQYLGEIRTALEAALKLLPAGANAKLSAILSTLDSIETVYAYAALRAGYDTNIKMADGVKIPTKNDLISFVSALFEKTEKDGKITYTYNADAIVADLASIAKWIDDRKELTLGAVLYELMGESLKELYPDVTDMTAFLAKLESEFPGTMLVKDALQKMMKLLIAQDMTLESAYSAIDTLVKSLGGEQMKEFSAEQMLAQYANLPLNELLTGMELAPSTADLFDMIEGMLSVTLGELEIPVPMPGGPSDGPMDGGSSGELIGGGSSEMEKSSDGPEMDGPNEESGPVISPLMISGMITGMLDAYIPAGGISFTVDEAGNLYAFDLTLDLDVKTGEDTKADLLFGSLTYEKDGAEIVVRDIFKPMTENGPVTYVIDKDGNIVIRGMDDGIHYTVGIEGYHDFNLADILVKDPVASAELGYEVYRLDKSYGYRYEHLGQYLLYEGKYYKYSYFDVPVSKDTEDSTVTAKVKLADFLADPTAYLPDPETAAVMGYLMEKVYYGDGEYDYNYENTTPFYSSVFGPVYRQDGEWYLIDTQNSSFWSFTQQGKLYLQTPVDQMRAIALADFTRGTYLSNLAYNTVDYLPGFGDVPEALVYSAFGFDGEEEYSTVGLMTCIEDDTVYVVGVEPVQSEKDDFDWYYLVDPTPVTLPAYDRMENIGFSSETEFMFADGTKLDNGKIKFVSLSVAQDSFYCKVADGVFVNVDYRNSGIGYAPVGGMQTLTLPDGNVMYVKGQGDVKGKPVTYGYVKLSDAMYVQAYVYDEGGEVVYRNGVKKVHIDLSNIIHPEKYISVSDGGVYTVGSEVLKRLHDLMDEGEEFRVTLNGEGDGIEQTFILYAEVNMENVSISDLFGGAHEDGAIEDVWYQWFRSDSYGLQIVPNEDGTVTVYHTNGGTVTIDYDVYGMPVNGFVTYDSQKSAQLGFPVYSAKQLDTKSGYYVLQNGRYYRYHTRSVATVEYFASSDITPSDYRFSDLALMIPANAAAGKPDIYSGYVEFDDLQGGLNLFFIIEDSKIKVLTGARYTGEYAIEWEREVLLSTYFEGLRFEAANANWRYDIVEIDGVQRTIERHDVTVYESTALTGLSTEFEVGTVYVLSTSLGGRTRYIKSYEREGSRMVLDGLATDVPADHRVEYTYTMHCVNGVFEMVDLAWDIERTCYYLEAAGKYYDITDYAWYEHEILNYEGFANAFADIEWVFGVKKNGALSFYASVYYGDGSYTAYEPVDAPSDTPDRTHLLFTANDGTEIWQYVYYKTDVTPITVGGDKVWLDSTGNGFVEIADGMFLRGTYVEANGDEPAAFYIERTEATVSDATLRASEAVAATYTELLGGEVLVLTPEFLAFFEDYQDVTFKFRADGMSVWISYDELAQKFAAADDLKNGAGK